MNGEIAALFQGKQVGGLYSWEIDLQFNSTIKNGWREFKVINKRISATSYWLNFIPEGRCFEVKFYKVSAGQLVLIDQGKVEIDLPDKTLDKKIHIPLEIRWLSVN